MKKVILCVIFIALVSASCYVAPPGERETSVSHPPAISEPKSTVPSIVATGEPGEAGAELLIDTEAKELYPKVSPTNPDVIAYISCGTKGLKHYDIWMRNLLEKSSSTFAFRITRLIELSAKGKRFSESRSANTTILPIIGIKVISF